MSLNPQQEIALARAYSHLSQGRDFLISGGAGTGKSYLTTEILKLLPTKNIIFTAPTNKASHILEGNVRRNTNISATVRTTHKILSVEPKEEGSKRLFKPGKKFYETDGWQNTILIVDECGTLNEQLIYWLYDKKELIEEETGYTLPILHLGDPYQLFPVKEGMSIIWDLFSDSKAHLSQVMRYGGGILKTAEYLQQHIDSSSIKISSENDGSEGVFRIYPSKLPSALEDVITQGSFGEIDKNGIPYAKLICWKNETVQYWNEYIRQFKYGTKAENNRFLPGESIVALEPCYDKRWVGDYKRKIKLLDSSTEAIIQKVAILPSNYSFLQCYYLECISEFEEEIVLRVLHEDYNERYNTALKELKDSKKYNDYWELKDYFHEITLSSAINVYRAQGSTYHNVVVDYRDIMSCTDIPVRNRQLNVAVTRATTKVII